MPSAGDNTCNSALYRQQYLKKRPLQAIIPGAMPPTGRQHHPEQCTVQTTAHGGTDALCRQQKPDYFSLQATKAGLLLSAGNKSRITSLCRQQKPDYFSLQATKAGLLLSAGNKSRITSLCRQQKPDYFSLQAPQPTHRSEQGPDQCCIQATKADRST